MNIEQIKKYIQDENLNEKSREHFYVFRRHYLCWFLYQSNELTLSQIGRMFNRHHATVLHSIRKHKELKNDKLYRRITETCQNLMSEPITFTRQTRNIFDDIAKASNLEKLRRIRRWLDEGKYNHQINAISNKVYEKIKDSFENTEQVAKV
jgi:DNA-binding transcriptional MerR regulator